MSEYEKALQYLKRRGPTGISRSDFVDDFEPIGEVLIAELLRNGDIVSRRQPDSSGLLTGTWMIYHSEFDPLR